MFPEIIPKGTWITFIDEDSLSCEEDLKLVRGGTYENGAFSFSASTIDWKKTMPEYMHKYGSPFHVEASREMDVAIERRDDAALQAASLKLSLVLPLQVLS